MEKEIARFLQEQRNVCSTVEEKCLADIVAITKAMQRCLKKKGKIVFCGNGGSAADAQHLATELVCRLYIERKALPALALSTNTSLLTAQGNDCGFDSVFSRQVEALVHKNDVVVGISTSGNSENVLKAIGLANEIGALTVGFSGGNGGKLARLAKLHFIVPSAFTPHIQEMHVTIGHIICQLIEEEICREKK